MPLRPSLLSAFLLLQLLPFFSAHPSESVSSPLSSRTLEIEPPAPETTHTLPLAETPSFRPQTAHFWIVWGRFQPPELSLTSLDQIGASDGFGRPLPLLIETDTLAREFGEIVGLTVAFELDPASLDAGPPRIEWGNILARSNQTVSRLSFPSDSTGRLRRFSLPASESPANETQLATIAIIADSHADYYFWWYLLPMAVVFVLLALNKAWTR